MDHLKALGLKFVAIFISVFAIFELFSDVGLGDVFWLSVAVTAISYIIGDLFILPRYGNITATLSDFGLAFLSLWLLGGLFIDGDVPIIILSLLAAFFIACCEPFIHGMVVNNIEPDTREDLRGMNQLQTEFAEEIDPKSQIKEEQKNSEKQ